MSVQTMQSELRVSNGKCAVRTRVYVVGESGQMNSRVAGDTVLPAGSRCCCLESKQVKIGVEGNNWFDGARSFCVVVPR